MKHNHPLSQDCRKDCPSWDYAQERKAKNAQKQDVASQEPVDLNSDAEFMDTGVLHSDDER